MWTMNWMSELSKQCQARATRVDYPPWSRYKSTGNQGGALRKVGRFQESQLGNKRKNKQEQLNLGSYTGTLSGPLILS